MNVIKILAAFLLAQILGMPVHAQEINSFYPAIFWSENGEKGAVVISPSEILVLNTKGEKLGKVVTLAPVIDLYFSPDGKKIAYVTSKGLWLAKLDTKENYQVSSAVCADFEWSKDGLSFIYVISEKDANSGGVKILWADGDGKNLKQVYP